MAMRAEPGKKVELVVAYVLATGHALVGLTGILAPRFRMWYWAGPSPGTRHVRGSGLVVGVRDLALGAGALTAVARGEIKSVWSECAALSVR